MSLPDNIRDDMQCSVAKFGGTAINDDVTVTADVCSKKHPYFCIKWITGIVCNRYTPVCPPVGRDNPRAFASGLSPVQVDKP